MDLHLGDQGLSSQYVLYSWQTGDLLVPKARGSELPTKPPLFVWTRLVSAIPTGGPTEWSLRLHSIFDALVLIALTWIIARRLLPPPGPEIAALVLAANYVFLKISVLVRPDALLSVLVAGSICSLLRALDRGSRGWSVLGFALAGLGVLMKGPVALLFVFFAVVPWARLRGDRLPLSRIHPWIGSAVVLVVTLGWFVPALLSEGRPLWDVMVRGELVRHAKGGEGEFWSHLVEFPGRFLPWIVMLPWGLVLAWRQRKEDPGWPLGLAFLWFVPSFVFLSFVGSKRVDHLAPLVPAAAVLTAAAILRSPRLTAWTAGVTAVVLGIGAAVALLPVRLPEPFGERRLMLAASGAAIAAVAALGALAARRNRPLAATLALFAVFAGGTAVWFHGLPEKATSSPAARIFAARARAETPEGLPLMVMGTQGVGDALLFRLGRAEAPSSLAEVVEAAERLGRVYVATLPKGEERLRRSGLGVRTVMRHTELDKYPRFRLLEVTRP